jgi:protein-glutamine gamma-glutamyltransferase
VKQRLLAALPLLLGALALGHAAAWPLALSLVLVIAVVTALGARWDVDAGRQWLSSAIGGGLGYVLVAFAYEAEAGRLGDGWAKLSAAALLAGLARSLLIAPRGGFAVTLALGFVALSFAGKTTNPAYAAYAVSFVVSGVWALAESARPSSPVPGARRMWMGALVLAVAATLGLGTTSGLRQLHAWAQARTRHTSTVWQPRVGFSERMDLGALDGLLDSDRRVLRVRGARIDYLRGAVLDVYERGRWIASDAAELSSKLELDASPGPAAVEISAIADRLDRFFMPLEAAELAATPRAVLVSDVGVVRPEAKRVPWTLRFVPGARQKAQLAPPRATDLHLPRRVKQRITTIARDWTEASMTDAEKLRAIERHLLSEFGYSRSVGRSRRMDPLIDFLLVQRQGHCEYFASALALLARAVGVPTRVVMGYRVSERSPFGYYVVRERNAHAWVEAWLPGVGWTTHDATPADAQPSNREHEASYFASSLDALGVGYDDLTDWLGRRTLTQTGLAWVGGCLVLALIVARGVRRRSRRETIADDAALLPFMLPLLDALDRDGHARRLDEPLERLAARLPDAEPARLLRRYSALRYGGIGDRDALARDVNASVEALRRRA